LTAFPKERSPVLSVRRIAARNILFFQASGRTPTRILDSGRPLQIAEGLFFVSLRQRQRSRRMDHVLFITYPDGTLLYCAAFS